MTPTKKGTHRSAHDVLRSTTLMSLERYRRDILPGTSASQTREAHHSRDPPTLQQFDLLERMPTHKRTPFEGISSTTISTGARYGELGPAVHTNPTSLPEQSLGPRSRILPITTHAPCCSSVPK